MFDFAIEHNQRQRPSELLYICGVVSFLLHVLFVIVLIENPWLLQGGINKYFRGLVIAPDTSEYGIDLDDDDYRTVAVLKPMQTPPAEILRELIYDWDKPKAKETGSSSSAQARWGSEEETAPKEDIKLSAKINLEPEPTPAGKENASDLANTRNENMPETGQGLDRVTIDSSGVIPEPTPQKETIPSVDDTPDGNDIALNVSPPKIPDAVPRTEIKNQPETIKVFEDEAQAINERGSGLFDNQGFPLDEYASRIKQLVTRNWYIPSNLRGSNAYTTIIFYIDREGKSFDIRTVESSGNNSLNLTALNAIINSDPFPPLPKDFPGDHVGVKYVFIPEVQ
jgi:TonB family protein